MDTMNKVSYEAFTDYLKEHFTDHLSASFLKREPVVEIKDGSLFVVPSSIGIVETPKILVGYIFEQYRHSEEVLEPFIDRVARGYEERINLEPVAEVSAQEEIVIQEKPVEKSHTVVNDFPDWRERVFIAVSGLNDDAVFSSVPHIKKGNYAIFCQIGLGDKNISGCYDYCRTVTYDAFNSWNVDSNQLFDIATTNSQIMFPGELQSISSYDANNNFSFFTNRVFVLSNKYHFNGAAALFYQPELLSNMSVALGDKNFILFPSEYNEILCLAIDRGAEWKDYQALFDNFRSAASIENSFGTKILLMDCEKKNIQQLDGVTFTPEIVASKRINQSRRM